jgi:hypothetical protein
MAWIHQLQVIIMMYCWMLHDAKWEQGINLQNNHVLQWMTSIQDSFHVALLCMKIMFFTFSQAKNVLPQSPHQNIYNDTRRNSILCNQEIYDYKS